MGVDVSPALASLSKGKNHYYGRFLLATSSLIFLSLKGADAVGWEAVNKDAADDRHLALCCAQDTFSSNGTITPSAFNLHRHQCCYDYHYYSLHHYHQSRPSLILKHHQ